ncbi:MAG: hypothetical protein QXY39_05650 [Thermofilaceae archaeon]
MKGLIDGIVNILKELYPDYDIMVRYGERTIRVVKPTIIVGVSDSTYKPYTLGYQHMVEENIIQIRFIYTVGKDVLIQFEKAQGDLAKLINRIRISPFIGEYILTLLQSGTYRDMLENPGMVIVLCELMAMRIIPKQN